MAQHVLYNGLGYDGHSGEEEEEDMLDETIHRLALAVRGGDLPTLKLTLGKATEKVVSRLLLTRLPDTYPLQFHSMRRLGHCGLHREREVYVRNPSLLILATLGLHDEILFYLSSFKVGLEETCVLEDNGNSCHEYSGATALHMAAMSGKLKMVQSLLSCGSSANKFTNLGDTPLHEATYENHPEIVRLLHKHGADLDAGNVREVTPLMVAAYADSAEVVKYIVDSDTDLKKVDKDGRNAVFYAVVEGKLDTLVFLLDNGLEVKPDHQGVTALMEAVYHNQPEIVRYLLEQRDLLNIDLNGVDKTGRNVLFYLSHHEDTSLLEFLLYWDIPLEPTVDGRSLLMSAALHNNQPLTLYLINNCYKLGLDINEKDTKGRNVLFYCITGGDVALLELLITNDVPIQPSTDGVTILMQAVAKNRSDVIQYLLEKIKINHPTNLDLWAQDSDGWDVLMYAVASGNISLFEELIKAGARCQKAEDGRTVIMQAASKGDMPLLRHLLHHARDLDIDLHDQDIDGWNSIFYAVQGGYKDAFRLLLNNGVKVTAAHNGSNILMEAIDKSHPEIVSYILKASHMLGVDIKHKDHQGNNASFYAVATGSRDVFQQLLDAGCPVVNDMYDRNLLMQAVLHGHDELLRILLEKKEVFGMQADQKDVDGRNLLFYCVEGGHLHLLKFLVDLDIGLSFIPDCQGRTNLMQASRASHVDIVSYILDNAIRFSIDINAKDCNGENAIFYAARGGSLEIIKLLLKAGVVLASNKAGVNVLPQCLSEEKWAIVETILNSDSDVSEAINSKDIKGRTVLHHLVEKDRQDMLAVYGKHYDAEADSDIMGCSLLMLACKHAPNMNMINYLIHTLNVDVTRLDARQRSALFYAVESCNIQVLELLLERTGSVHADTNGLTVLHVAVATGNHYIVDSLLKSKIAKQLLNSTDKHGRTEMHYAAIHGYTSLVELLSSHGTELNTQDEEGVTPAMHTCKHSRGMTLCTLLRKGADPDQTDNMDRSAMHHCLLSNNPSLNCVKILVKFGVNVNLQDRTGRTALMSACEQHSETHISVIRYLVNHGADPVLQDKEGKDSFDYCPFNADYVKALMKESAVMSPAEQNTIEQYREKLLQELKYPSVLRGLQQHGIFTSTLVFEVMKKPSKERAQRLMELLVFRGTNAFRTFCKVLKETGMFELSYNMLKQAYRRNEEIYW